jgi:hypothetical protein
MYLDKIPCEFLSHPIVDRQLNSAITTHHVHVLFKVWFIQDFSFIQGLVNTGFTLQAT